MSIAEREYILHAIHGEAEAAYDRHGWQDEPHGVWLHAFTAERLVQMLIRERQRCSALEAKVARLEARVGR